jgi:hypothetical protein
MNRFGLACANPHHHGCFSFSDKPAQFLANAEIQTSKCNIPYQIACPPRLEFPCTIAKTSQKVAKPLLPHTPVTSTNHYESDLGASGLVLPDDPRCPGNAPQTGKIESLFSRNLLIKLYLSLIRIPN